LSTQDPREHCLDRRLSERDRSEEALRVGEERYRALFDASLDCVYVHDFEGRFLDANPAALDLLGYGHEEILSLPFNSLLDEGQLAKAREALTELKTTGAQRTPTEYRLRRKTGEYIHVETKASVIFRDGQPYAVQGIARDVTERRRAEQALKDAETRYRLLFEHSPDGVVVVEATTARFLEFNEKAHAQLGYSREEFARLGIFDIEATETQAEVERHIANVMRDGSDDFETRQRTKQGDIRDVHVTAQVIDILGHPVYHCIWRDITERKRAEAEKARLEAQNRQLQKSESLGRMAGAIAHHFNNQLQTVMGNLELALEELPRGAVVARDLNLALLAAHKAAEVSGLMLTYLGQTPAKREPLDLARVCRESLPMLQAVLPKDVILDADLSSSSAVIRANANQMRQVLTNLLTNAWEALGEGQGTVRLTVTTATPTDGSKVHRFPLSWQPQEEAYACLEVADTGCGIADEDIDRLFDPFFSSRFIGRGMGLSVVLGIVRAHGGAITVASEPGNGSTFRVYLPLTLEEVPRPPEPSTQASSLERGGTVLLVEDEEMVRQVAARLLARLGFEVIEAKDGIDALEAFRHHSAEIRCVLCDLSMPRLNGWETLAALRRLAPGLPVILASGYSEEQVMEGHYHELPQGFLGKPYGSDEVRTVLGRALSGVK
jgi:two-component system cell cycle sensor histidine kinase/response regulator CckA